LETTRPETMHLSLDAENSCQAMVGSSTFNAGLSGLRTQIFPVLIRNHYGILQVFLRLPEE
jgi:hypothetical protein